MGSAINLDDIKRYEVTEVYSHPDAKVDIVLVHGLNGNPRNTWTAPNGVFWPSQLLPASLKSFQARILVYGYNADVYTFGSSKGGPSSDMIHQHAQTLLANLALERKSEEVAEHPIIWVAHSLGGILVKRALELSFDLQGNHDDDLRSIFVSTFGVIFLGTPHTGADPAKWGLILQGMVNTMVPKKLFETHSQLVKTLQSNNEILQNINLRFLDLYPNRLRICMVHEGHPTDLKGTKHLIVDQTAASPQLPDVQYFGIEATHSGMCKFESKNAPGFTNVSVTLRSWVQECPEFIRTRWDVERLLRKQKREDEIAQLQRLSGLLPSTPHMTSTPNTPEPGSVYSSMVIAKSTISIAPEDPAQDAPYFIKPSGFRPNSLFVGREAELELMHKMLFDKKRRADGTCAVLLQSLPGGGKTHLARQYVYNHKDDFPGGIFWLRAKSETELAAGFWDIARKAALKHPVGTEEAGSKEDPEQFIKMVRKWLDKRHDWLIVLDGIHFSHSTLRKFIPDSTNTSIIYTSTEKSVIGDHHFMNPQLIRLPLLSAREAQRLLLLELGRTEPFAKDDLRYSMELVQSMGFLPVVIHAVAQRLKTTDEPLSKFARTYSSEPRLRGLGTYIAVVEQLKGLGANEALNLINILCFFSQHIPVEMISLGLRSLPPTISVKAHEPVSGNSLNNTFKILNRFALIDRNDHDNDTDRDKDPAASSHSQTSKRSRDMLADNVDVIRLHSVVQGFFLDTLSADGSLLLWLDLATRLFCCSYDMANERISRKTHAGLVEDYRLYEIHGNKLSEHLAKHLSKRLSPRQKEILHEADDMLAQRLVSVKNEIDRRTPESSSVIVAVAGGGKQEVFQTSIFDRTSSSSDTGPETPGKYDGLHSGIGISTWGMESEKSQFESPVREKDFGRRVEGDGVSIYQQQPQQPHFPFPLAMPEDPGYESDREEVNAYTMSSPLPLPITSSSPPSQRPISSDTNASPKWETMPPRNQRQRPRPRPIPNPLYRTLPSALSPTRRNKDIDFHTVSAGAIVPHVSHDHAKGFLQTGTDGLGNGSGKGGLRAQSRGRLSGQSGAEVSLAHLRRNSPLSPRGGGTIGGLERGGGGSRRGSEAVERGRIMMTGLSSYAAAVVKGSTRDTVEGLRGLVGLGDGEADGDGGREGDSAVVDDDNDADAESGTADVHGGGSGREQYQERPHISALESLQKIPIRHSDNPVLMPPYPPSPSGTPAPGFVLDEGRDGNGNVFAAQDTENIYPRREGYPPLEHLSSSITKSNENDYRRLSPKPINHPQKSSHRQRNTQSESLPASLLFSRSNLEDSYAGGLGGRIHPSTSETNLDLMSLSYPGLREQRRLSNSGSTSSGVGPYYPGRPELSNLELERGYESLPMSRDPSGLSGLSGQSADSGRGNGVGRSGRGRGRRGSVAETEPDLGSRLRELGFESRRERAIEGKGNGNRLEFARAALIESLDEWGQGGENSPPTQSQRTQSTPPQLKGQLKPSPNLTAPFSPSPSQGSGMVNSFASYTSPYPPDNTPDLGWNGGAGSQKPSPSQRYLSPNPNSRSSPRTSPHYNIQQKASPRTSPPLSSPNLGGERMDRHSSGSGSGSGGVRIRGRNGSEAGGRETGMDRMITFGDYPEPVDVEYVLALEREWERERPGVLRSWGERERVERHRREETRGKGVSEREEVGLGISGGVVELEGRGGG